MKTKPPIWKSLRGFLSLVMLLCWLVPTGRAQSQTYNSPDFNNSNRVFTNVPVTTVSSLTVLMKTNHPGGGINIMLRANSGTPTGQFTANIINSDGSTGSAVNCYGLHNGVVNAFTTSGSLGTIGFQNFEQWTCPYVPGGVLGVTLNAFTLTGNLSFEWVSTVSPFTINPLAIPWTFTHISTATNTQVKGFPGFLHTITINGGTVGAVTVVDTSAANCTGGTTIAVLLTGLTATQSNSSTLIFDAQLNNGLCITTAAATDITVNWK